MKHLIKQKSDIKGILADINTEKNDEKWKKTD